MILMQNGYFHKKDKCSRNFITMSNDSDLIVITRQTNGQYLYFNPNEESDRGNIYSFVKIGVLKSMICLMIKSIK